MTAPSLRTRYCLTALWMAMVIVPGGGALWAVQPGVWTHTTEADFEPGQNDGTVVTNLGDVKLSAATESIAQMPEQASIIYDLLDGGDGAIYLAAGPEAKLLVRRGDAVEELVSLPGEQIFCLDRLADSMLVGISAEGNSRLALLHDGKLLDVVKFEGVRYVWDLAVSGRDVFVATGTEGQIIRVLDAAGHVAAVKAGAAAEPPATAVVLDAATANVLCLGMDGAGRLYAGTDGDGLVYRLTPKADAENGFEAFVLYDAPEPEIGAILVMADGTVYVGTSDADQARPGRLSQAAEQEAGRPGPGGEGAAAEPDAPGDGDAPEPPDVPEPGDLPQVPPKAPPVGDTEGDAADADAVKPEATPAPDERRDDGALIGARRPDTMAEPGEAKEAPATPTPEQFDRLRAVIRQRLDEARRTGALQAGRPMNQAARRPGGAPAPAGGSASAGSPPKEGNAIYRIDPLGFVSEVFRESVMILRLAEIDGRLLVATGNEGQIYRVDPVSEETTILADLEPQQVPAILVGPDGSQILGTANPATLVRLGDGFAATGQYTSVVLDAAQISLWGKFKLTGSVPTDATVTVQTRSGNVQNVDDAAWSPWADAGKFAFDPNLPASIAFDPREIDIASPPARFLQYRLVLTAEGEASPAVTRVQLAYVTPNLRPAVTSITAQYADAPAGGPGNRPGPGAQAGGAAGGPTDANPNLNVNWEASDPNGNRLIYTLEYQPAASQVWLPLAKDLDANTFEWNTRHAPDGRYLIRVTASDRSDNPPDMAKTANRVSDPVLIDNTSPSFADLVVRRERERLTIEGRAIDALSPIRAIHYTLGGPDRYQPILSKDLIFDSTNEAFAVTISDLAPGPQVVTLRATDERGNHAYEAVLVQ